jgi:hypothetical protein
MNSDERPPRLMSYVTAGEVNYNGDFIEYCVNNEVNRLKAAGQPPLSQAALFAFRQQVVRCIIAGRSDLALTVKTNVQQLFE